LVYGGVCGEAALREMAYAVVCLDIGVREVFGDPAVHCVGWVG